MGLFDNLFRKDEKKNAQAFGLFSFMEDQSKKDNELEDEMNRYGLDEWQKDLVRKGEYNPWNFEEDGNLEDDDYYYEDDK